MENEKKNDGACCSTTGACGCCSGCKKFVMGLLLGVILTLVIGFCLTGGCPMGKQKICPVSGSPLQMQK